MTHKEKLTSNYLMARRKRGGYLPISLVKSAGKAAKEIDLVPADLTDLGAGLTLIYNDAELFDVVVTELPTS